MTDEQRAKQDIEFLINRPEFRRFLFAVIQRAGLFSATTDGSGTRDLSYYEGRRNLGLEILDMAERGQPIPEVHPAGPLLTIIQALHEETSATTEKPNARRKDQTSYNRLDELADTDADPE